MSDIESRPTRARTWLKILGLLALGCLGGWAAALAAREFRLMTPKNPHDIKASVMQEGTVPYFLDVAGARDRLDRGAIAVDVRGTMAFLGAHLPGARRLPWQDGAVADSGVLRPPEELVALLGSHGIARDSTVVVYGDFDAGWGEEGRVAWMLRALGVERTAVLLGGFAAWRKADAPIERGPARSVTPVAWPAPPSLAGALSFAAVRGLVRHSDALLLDVRTPEEFAGATPYGSVRGGHLPTARELAFRDLFAAGHLVDAATLRAHPALADLVPGQPVVTYCTGGVRSAFAALVLLHHGFTSVANYAGSWWEWSGRASPDEARSAPVAALIHGVRTAVRDGALSAARVRLGVGVEELVDDGAGPTGDTESETLELATSSGTAIRIGGAAVLHALARRGAAEPTPTWLKPGTTEGVLVGTGPNARVHMALRTGAWGVLTWTNRAAAGQDGRARLASLEAALARATDALAR